MRTVYVKPVRRRRARASRRACWWATPQRRLIVVRDAGDVGRVAAEMVARVAVAKPDAVLALPTGQTPLPLYRELVRRFEQGLADFSGVTTFNLDEFYGISPEDPGSFTAYMRRELFRFVDLPKERVNLLNPQAADPGAEAYRYERAIERAGGIDLAILGIGGNGHIAFNEPGSRVDSRTRLVSLTSETIADNQAMFDGSTDVPRRALTMGLATIMAARRVLLLAAGRRKSAILARALVGPVEPWVPASILQRHPRLTVIADRQAVAGLAGVAKGYRMVEAAPEDSEESARR